MPGRLARPKACQDSPRLGAKSFARSPSQRFCGRLVVVLRPSRTRDHDHESQASNAFFAVIRDCSIGGGKRQSGSGQSGITGELSAHARDDARTKSCHKLTFATITRDVRHRRDAKSIGKLSCLFSSAVPTIMPGRLARPMACQDSPRLGAKSLARAPSQVEVGELRNHRCQFVSY